MKLSDAYPNGISSYSKATLTVYFPMGKMNCDNCWLKNKDSSGRDVCRRTNNLIFDTMGGVDRYCPLEIEESEDKA